MNANIIETSGLGKRYGSTWALRECSLAVPAGHVTALVGPNGAGKTTLLNLAVGLAEPTAGTVTVLGGLAAGSPAALDGIAFVAQDTPLYKNLSAADMLHLTRNLNRRFDQPYAKARLGELGIPLNRRAGKLSGGQQAQLALTLALARRPRLLVLDEPVAMLDPLARHDFMALVLTAAADDGVSVLLSSHVLAELERVADYLILLSRGRVQVAGEVDDLIASHRVLTGPAAEADRYTERPLVHARRADAQAHLLVRATADDPVPPRWEAHPVGLEELAMAYLREPGAGALPGPARGRDTHPDGGDEMTALTMPGRPAHDARLRPVPWRRMAWVTWRQHRAALGGVAAFLGAFAVYLWLTGLQMHHAEAAYCHPAGSLRCAINFTGRYGETAIIVSIALQAVPALIGAFAGAPVLARELETGTFRYAWTQGIGRLRWTVGKLVPLAVAVTAVAGALTVLFAWYNQPWVAAGYVTPFSARVFDLLGVAFAAWTLAAFAIGVLAGMLIRRAVPALAATLAAYAGLALAAAVFLRERYLTPLVTHSTNLPGSAWIINNWYTKDGKLVSQSAIRNILQGYHRAPATRVGPNTFQTILNAVGYLTKHGYTHWISYQPGSRFWPFQWIEGGWLLALSVLLIAATVWLARRRSA